ncbi:hypothetical protein AVEN_24463-1 [Araneus ventricosus]|uniref:Uncharacterized protein n=1 Tax=Araneus ventricosus TaxID=182803 RepID=A0A4Y2V5Q3_ARAVE|nr:hypothetical protein AVEN_24463-1 [Araneus ventricosus]
MSVQIPASTKVSAETGNTQSRHDYASVLKQPLVTSETQTIGILICPRCSATGPDSQSNLRTLSTDTDSDLIASPMKGKHPKRKLNKALTLKCAEQGTGTTLYSSPIEVANIIGQGFARVFRADSYSPTFLVIKSRAEQIPLNFKTRKLLPCNCAFRMFELKKALSEVHDTRPGPDGITYSMLRRLDSDSLTNLCLVCLTESGNSRSVQPSDLKQL